MKQGTTFIRIAMLVLFLGLVCYFGFSAWNSLTDPFSTTYAYEYTADDSVEVTGLLVRWEQVLPGQSGIVDLRFGEGEKVGAGQVVANLYQTGEALERSRTIHALTLEAEQLQYAMSMEDADTNARLDETIIEQAVALRAAAARQDFTQLEDQVLELKSTVLKREYVYGDSTDLSSLEEQLSQVRTQLQALRTQSSQDSSRVQAPAAGVFSALVDGYEALVSPEDLSSMTPGALTRLMDSAVTEDASALGKLITGNRWYFAAAMSAADAGRLAPDDLVVVRFSRDFSADVTMRVESLGPEEDGQVVVTFSSSRYLSETTLLRKQTVDVIFESSSGIRVPKQALHLEEQTITDEAGNETVQTVYGVYAVVGARAEFKPVEIVGESGDFYVVRSIASDKTALRPGNEIILAAQGLYDGKVVR